MGGGLMQLVAYGAQDVFLTGNPQITFFKVVYRRHTNFSIEAIKQTWNGTSKGANGRCTSTISRNGDLIYRMYLEITTVKKVDVASWILPNPGASVIDTVELEIGGQIIDKHHGHWMETWAELTQPNNNGIVRGIEINKPMTEFQRMSGMGGVVTGSSLFTKVGAENAIDILFIPLQFWFCRNPGLALPLIALQYHEVKIILEHRMLDVVQVGQAGTNDLWVDYIYLDTDERRRFAQVSHEYLIEQVQHASFPGGSDQATLNFNHPVKELIWTSEFKRTTCLRNHNTGIKDKTFTLLINGQERFEGREYGYFSRTQVWEHHSGCGGLASYGIIPAAGDAAGTTAMLDDSICVYSFALKPEEHQPSGTCNFSRIDNSHLKVTSASATTEALEIYAVNYNVLRVMSGMGGLAYSN